MRTHLLLKSNRRLVLFGREKDLIGFHVVFLMFAIISREEIVEQFVSNSKNETLKKASEANS